MNVFYKASQSVKLLQIYCSPDCRNKELKLIETDQNKIKSQFESLKKLVLPHLSIVKEVVRRTHFFCLYKISILLGPSAKKRCSIEDVRVFQKYWTEKFGVIEKDNKTLSIFCFETVVRKTSSIKRHFESVHNNISNKTEEEKRELISSAFSKKKKKTG